MVSCASLPGTISGSSRGRRPALAKALTRRTRAVTNASHISLVPVPGSRPPLLQIADFIIVDITFDARTSWQASWVQTMPQADKARLLRHEQGHYTIAALIARDFFLALMQLKGRSYANQAALRTDINALNASHLAKIQPAQDRYDADTVHGSVQTQQDRWNNFFSTAFTRQRTPPATAADGVPLKLPLLEVLSAAGIRL